MDKNKELDENIEKILNSFHNQMKAYDELSLMHRGNDCVYIEERYRMIVNCRKEIKKLFNNYKGTIE